MTDTVAQNTIGTGVYIKVAGEWKELKEVKSTPELGTAPSRLEATHLKCTSKVYVNGVSDPGSDLSVTCNAMPGGTTDSNLDLVSGLDPTASYPVSFRFPRVGKSYEFQAQITGKMAAASVDAIQEFTVSFTPTSDVTIGVLSGEYHITYDANGGTGGPVTDNMAYTPGAQATIKANTYTKTGSTFGGWAYNAEGTGTKLQANQTITMVDDLTLYAVWTTTGGGS